MVPPVIALTLENFRSKSFEKKTRICNWNKSLTVKKRNDHLLTFFLNTKIQGMSIRHCVSLKLSLSPTYSNNLSLLLQKNIPLEFPRQPRRLFFLSI